MADILLIEDDGAIRTALSRGLRDLGHAVSSSPTAFEGLRLAVEDRPDLVVLDLGLPDLDGVELLRMLRAVSRVPVCACWSRRRRTACP
ncbi:response regulator [Nonomuraea sp. NPDC050691]|uniref:response regulator n=1 Tax=Nonomuraea sp. NPDC050691 TaxID=3155661 RepID=UPI003408973F